MKFPARVLGTLFAFLLIIFVTKVSFAQTLTPSLNPTLPQQQNILQSQYTTPNTNPDVPKNLHTWTQNVIIEVLSAMACQLAGLDPISSNHKCLGIDQTTGKIGFVESGGGAIGVMASMVGDLYVVPVRVGNYVADVSNDFGIAKTTHAQSPGIGFEGLEPVLNLWKVIRDIAYLVFIVIFLIVGLAIMLRVRIDPRTVMTIQNQIPKLIIGIIMITFSYAIAGFLIDLMWITNYAVINVVSQGDTQHLNQQEIAVQTTGTAPFFVNYIFGPGGGLCPGGVLDVSCQSADSVGNLVQDFFLSDHAKGSGNTSEGACPDSSPDCNTPGLLEGPIGDIVGTILGFIIGFFARIITFLIFAIVILVALFKLWFTLIKAYIYILIDVVLAPFWIVAGLLPGGNGGGFGSWVRDLVGNLAVFPVVIALLMFGRVIFDNFGGSPAGYDPTKQFSPPLIGHVGETSSLGPLIALGIILMLPHIADSVKKTIKEGKFTPPGSESKLVKGMGMAFGGAIGNRLYHTNPYTGQKSGSLANLAVNSRTKIGSGVKKVTSAPPVRAATRVVTSNPITNNPVSKFIGRRVKGTVGLFRTPPPEETPAQKAAREALEAAARDAAARAEAEASPSPVQAPPSQRPVPRPKTSAETTEHLARIKADAERRAREESEKKG